MRRSYLRFVEGALAHAKPGRWELMPPLLDIELVPKTGRRVVEQASVFNTPMQVFGEDVKKPGKVERLNVAVVDVTKREGVKLNMLEGPASEYEVTIRPLGGGLERRCFQRILDADWEVLGEPAASKRRLKNLLLKVGDRVTVHINRLCIIDVAPISTIDDIEEHQEIRAKLISVFVESRLSHNLSVHQRGLALKWCEKFVQADNDNG
eukprot:TRINITY_DN26717_c0_g1_i1.p1 TRINITY_DN26717_c0_g1~~TRINITY_DN26717_c0_g1_i1.p1  ORF type:complete len:235 (+),score=49.13 TRINITY_DN26717_c0_g1_i1:82-705(+)